MLRALTFYGLVAAAAAAFGLALLDFALNDEQKQSINNSMTRLWWWVSDLKDHSLIDWLRLHQFWIWAAAVAIECVHFGDSTRIFDFPSSWTAIRYHSLSVLLPAVLAFLVCFVVVRITLKSRSLIVALIPATAFLLIFVGLILLYNAQAHYLSDSGFLDYLFASPTTFTKLFWLLTILSLQSAVLALINLMVPFWLLIAIPIALIYLLQGTISLLEFVVRRTAEKGNALFVGAGIFSALAILLQALRS